MADNAPTPTTPSAPQVSENGYVYGIDGMLDQICGALARQGKQEWLPALQADTNLQQNIGAGIGSELAKPLWVIAIVIAGYAGWKMWTRGRSRESVRTNPWGRRESRRARRRAARLAA